VPVVATEVGGIPDIITNGENGLLVPPDDTPALTQAIRTLISNDDLRHSLARAHYEKSKTFTVEKMVEKTMAAYRQN
jgi:glycosyltransferase involved in cell wall biosynthesis